MQITNLFFAVRFTAILTIAAAVVTANADSHLPDCKANPRCLLFKESVVVENWTEFKAKWQSFTAADMQAMIDAGADVHAKENNGYTPLHGAAAAGNVEVIPVLLKAGADVNAKDKYGWTPLHPAATNGNAEVVPVLLKAGADVHAKSNNGDTPLHSVAIGGNAEVIPVLVKAGADVNATDNDGRTPLDFAIQEKHWAAARELENAGGKCRVNC